MVGGVLPAHLQPSREGAEHHHPEHQRHQQAAQALHHEAARPREPREYQVPTPEITKSRGIAQGTSRPMIKSTTVLGGVCFT